MTPPFYIVMIFLFILIVIAIDRRSWGQWARAGWTDLMIGSIDHREHDIEIRARYRKRALDYAPKLNGDLIIKYPDPVLDSMIFEGRLKEANEYRMRQVKEAKERHDSEAVETYGIYKAIISAREAADDERSRRTLRDRFPEIRDSAHETEKKGKYDPMEIVESPNKKPRERVRSGFLEIASVGIRRPPLKETEPEVIEEPQAEPVIIETAPANVEVKEEIKPAEIHVPEIEVREAAPVEPEEERRFDDEEDYTGLIKI
jgi:hypothetical protein